MDFLKSAPALSGLLGRLYLSFFLLELHKHEVSPLFILDFGHTEAGGESCSGWLAVLHLFHHLLSSAAFSVSLLTNALVLCLFLAFLSFGVLGQWYLCNVHRVSVFCFDPASSHVYP